MELKQFPMIKMSHQGKEREGKFVGRKKKGTRQPRERHTCLMSANNKKKKKKEDQSNPFYLIAVI